MLYLLVDDLTEKPLKKDLQDYVTPTFAVYWKEIGIGLGVTKEKIDIIEADNQQCVKQCNEMLFHWLEIDADAATWKKLLSALDSRAVQTQLTNGMLKC